MKKRILVTGSTGFIGRNIKEQLKDSYTIYSPTHKELDLTDRDSVKNYFISHQIDVVVNTASIGGKRNSVYISDSVEINLRMFFNLVWNKEKFEKLIQIGSGAEYDHSIPVKDVLEDDFGKSLPEDQYGFYKYICSQYALNDPKVTVLRTFGIFGKYEDFTTRFISNNICRVLFNMPVQINQNGYFDFIYITDFVKIVDYFIQNKTEEHIYNIGSSGKTDLLSIAKIIQKVGGSKEDIRVKHKGLQKEYTCDNEKLLRQIGEFQFTPLKTAINDLYNWYVTHRTLIDPKLLLFDK